MTTPKIAFLYPGQGSQYTNMGLDFAELADSQSMCEIFSKQVGFLAKQVLSDIDLLAKTQYSQCAIFLHSALVTEYLKQKKVIPTTCLGLSLGEFSSLYQANVLTFEQALPLIVKRAELMQDAFPVEGEFGMMAIRVADGSLIEDYVKNTNDVEIANYNTHQQWVLTGKMEALKTLNETYQLRGIFLKVSGAFHSPYLTDAAKKLQTFAKPLNIMIDTQNMSSYYGDTFKHVALDQFLFEQMISSVKLYPAICKLLDQGYNTFVEVGPGNTLSKMVKQISSFRKQEVVCQNIATIEQANAFIEQLKEN